MQPQWRQGQVAAAEPNPGAALAGGTMEVEEAQRLRYQVFAWAPNFNTRYFGDDMPVILSIHGTSWRSVQHYRLNMISQ